MLYLVEHFYSIQGEGKFVGTPSIFFRFGGCNLKCPSFGEYFVKGKIVYGCDTIRAVKRDLFQKEWKEIKDYKELIEILNDYLENLDFKPHIVLTGGEPLLYATDKSFYEFVKYLIENGFIVTIETNTTIEIDFEKYSAYKDVIFAMAVKLSNCGDPYEKRVNKKAIDKIVKNTKFSFFKFTLDRGLIETRAIDEIVDIVEPYPEVEIFCMPLGDKIDILKKHDKAVAEFCLIYGFIYSDRLHVRLWNREIRR
ncbi:7-carboxy-7-deazaguanine synthase QueE [Nitrosophilus kaiyonis]|uniref:7-carboxy-7-deazaguanine synthase QueE n=1 Tax=Nitrosophilus kaiyonis TaxID=2930200 RepID=UPI00249132EB|nr:7-carboxy-7-deazaguanine synthase QueE [Nitrosophilus kaiyonis]